MKIKGLIVCLLLAGFLACMSAKKEVPSEIIACGGHDIIIFYEEQSNGNNLKITWRWNIEEAKELPVEYQKYLNPLDECKPADGNSKILVTSSGGGVVLLDRATKKILFYANSPMAHSAECLPGNRIVVALSDHPYGNCVEVFDIATSEKCIYRDTLKWGHGVVWMPKQERLYALGSNDLVCYSLKKWDTQQPELNREKTWKLPEWGGHDLVSISDNDLVVTVAESVWKFNIGNQKFEPFEPLNEADVKSVNYNRTTRKLVYTKAEEEWWTHNIYSENPEKKYTIPDVNVYKARVLMNHLK
jgi:hypothetical protein